MSTFAAVAGPAVVSRGPSTATRFEAFYAEEADSVYRALSLALGDTELAREATDEAMTRAYQHWRKIAGYDNPAGWAYRVGLNWARSRIRKRSRERPVEPAPSWDDPTPDPALRAALARLSLPARSVIVLRYLLDWSTEQVAEALDIPDGTVKSRLSRALPELHRLLLEEDGR